MSQGLKYVGKETPRLAARDIVTGKAKFAQDLSVENMLYGKILHSPYAHANITSIDTSKAAALNGVEGIVTYQNAPDWIVVHMGGSHTS